ncbi:MAG: heme exporter protein CcmB [Parvularculaceae bacterium]|nr:heme exporter protein CcmB [Parvularculaceae bacterium]
MKVYWAIIQRDVSLAFRAGGGGLAAAAFLSIATVLFAIAIGPELQMLSSLAAPIIWASALLATMATLDRIFQSDFEDGSLDALFESPGGPGLIAFSKSISHWLSCVAPLILASPALAILLGMPREGFKPLFVSLLIGTPALSMIGVVAAALTLTLRRAVVLMSILTAPLFLPTIIFGVAAANAKTAPSTWISPEALLLCACSLISAAICPISAGAALRLNVE